MQSKSLLIAIAAFAVTATSAHAFGGTKILDLAGIPEEQRSAFEEAHQLRKDGNFGGARDILLEAGVNEDTLKSIKLASNGARKAMHAAMESEDFAAFKVTIEGTPLVDIVTSEEDFEQFVSAHKLKRGGGHTRAKGTYNDLGVKKTVKYKHSHYKILSELNDEQTEALRVAKGANDHDAVRAIIEEAGVEFHGYWRR